MNRNNLWRFFIVLLALLWSLTELYPPTPRNLIEEFKVRASKTDSNFTAIVARAEAFQADPKLKDNPFGNLLNAVGSTPIAPYFPFIDVKEERDPTRAILHRLQKDAAGKIKLGLDLQGGTSFLVAMDTTSLTTDEDKGRVLEQAIEVLRKRVDKFGVAEPIIQPVGTDRILISLPGLSEEAKTSARNQLQKPAFLEFRLVHERSNELVSQGMLAPGYELLKTSRKGRDGRVSVESFLVKKKAEKGLTGKFVKNALPARNPVSSEPYIHLNFDSEGAQKFAEITRDNVGRLMAIVLDGELYSAPRINEPILGGSASITGGFDIKEAYDLANVLENPLETSVKIEEESSVGPLLGKDSIRSGIMACVVGTGAVALFMLVYYMTAGMVANIALILNIIMLLGVMCSINTTLTVPGIAGIVLTIGMAVDANVLIFERMREEFAAGKSLKGAINAGYDKAFSTIFDSNLTTLIASGVLIVFGTGPVKGFGVTLTIGVAVSMFTALVATRLLFDWMLGKNMIKGLPMLHLIKGAKIDFISLAKPAFAISWAVILVGVAWGVFVRGKSTLGVEFAGGDRLTLTYRQGVEIEKVRETIGALKIGDSVILPQKDVSGRETLQVTTAFGTGDKVLGALKTQFPQAGFEEAGLYKAGPSVGKQIQRSAVIAVVLSLFGILVYVAFRYEFSFAVGAVVAVIHDVLMTLGIYFLSGRELSGTVIAAILTIIGFSINDTIVIFDRIREDLKLGVRGSFKDLMNHALNQTLSRTIITSGTVFISTASLYFFGGAVINDFAFCFLVGILTGTYSSIYIASALVLWWHKGERPKIGSQVTIDDGAAPVKA